MTVSETLKADIEAYVARSRTDNQLLTRARRGELTPNAVAKYLDGLRYLLQHTDVNLRLACARAAQLGRTELAQFFEHKAEEERGHEQWADSDMAGLTARFGVTSPKAPARSIASLLDYLRTIIVEEPTQYLAYILFVEYVTVLIGPEWLRLLDERCGIPVSLMSVIDKHVELDKEHTAEGLKEIDRLVDNPQSVEPLRRALRCSMEYFDGFCSEVSASVH
jgi:hypothetical protein